MRRYPVRLLAAAGAALVLAAVAPQPGEAAGKIVCWKDASGKTIGCGDTVPPEYLDAARRELDSRGVTRRTIESAEDVAKRREQAQAQARQKAEEEKRMAEQHRQDKALIATFSNTGEIDAKRDREIQTLDLQIKQQRAALKPIVDRYNSAKARRDSLQKAKQPVPAAVTDDVARLEEEKAAMEHSIAAKEKEQEAVMQRYADMKARYTQLRGGAAAK